MSFARAVPILLLSRLSWLRPSPRPVRSALGRARDSRSSCLLRCGAPHSLHDPVENISTGEALRLSKGQSAPFVSAPVLWVIHTGSTNPIFTGGQRDRGEGLELLAETGDPSKLVQGLRGKPGVVAVGAAARPLEATAEGPLTPDRSMSSRSRPNPGSSCPPRGCSASRTISFTPTIGLSRCSAQVVHRARAK